MDNSDASKSISSLHEITHQEQFLHGIKNMITSQHGEPFHLFDDTFHFFIYIEGNATQISTYF